MERKGEATKHQLAESFKELMLKGSFDKITIRMITEQAGVIRPTFYNYFQDKYEVMEWLLEEEVFRPVFEMVEDGMEREAIYLLFRKMEKDQQYYQKAFEVVNGLKYWLTSREVHMSADEALEFYRFLMSHPILDVVGQVEDYTEQEQTEG